MSTEKEPVYRLRLSYRASRYLLKLSIKTHKRILDRLEILKTNPHAAPGIKQLHGKLHGKYRIRIGSCRAIYEIDENNKIVVILFVGPRGDVYK